MKKMRVLFIGLFFAALGTASYAQAPYTHSIGGITGFLYGASYKTFIISDKLALQADLGTKLNVRSWSFWSLDLNPNAMYEQQIAKVDGLYWFAGGGISLGYMLSGRIYYSGFGYGRFGINAIGGVEYKFKFPLTLQADFRPGYGLLFRKNISDSYFDWGLNVSARYTF